MKAQSQRVTVDLDPVETDVPFDIRDSHAGSIEEAKRISHMESPTEEVLVAAGVGFRDDDPSLPCLTLRMWTIGIVACLVGTGVNTLYTFRFPSISLSQSAIQFLAYPAGKAWEYTIPDWGFSLFGKRHSLNPGPFNHKEHMLIYIMANLSFQTRLSADVLTEQRVFYGLKLGWGFELIITLVTILFGFSLAGISRSVIIDPKSLTWPGVLGNTALNAALHSSAKDSQSTVRPFRGQWKTSRYKFFLIAFTLSFVWYWFPDFIFPALGYFTWVCWIAPENAVVNQVFGMKSGIGLLPLTFDWSQISYTGSPLVVPAWAILNILAALVFWIYIVTPALYYTNTWSAAYFPIQSNSIFDNMGKTYNVSRVIDKRNGFSLDLEEYQKYSDIYLPTTYALNTFGLSFACISSLFVWLFLEKRHDLKKAYQSSGIGSIFQKRKSHGSQTVQPTHKPVPSWWYLVTLILSIGLGIFACEFYPVQLRWYGVLFAYVVSAAFFIPLALVCATTNLHVKIDVFCRIVAGYVWEGKVLANIWFFNLGYITGIKGLWFAQDLKLGIYCNIPPQHLFAVQAVGVIISALSQVAVINWALEHIPGICTKQAANGFTCPFSKTHFNTSMVWGALGPRRFFSPGSMYRPLIWFFLVGAILPVIVYLAKHKFPKTRWIHKIHAPLFLGGLNYIPPASGTNYGSWAIVGLVFGVWIKRHAKKWWMKYNFVLSAALDSSLAVAGIIIFFTVFYTGASDRFNWWGTTVHKIALTYSAMEWVQLKGSIAATRDVSSKVLLRCYRLREQSVDSKDDITAAISEIEALSDVCTELEKIDFSIQGNQSETKGTEKHIERPSFSACQSALDSTHSVLRGLVDLFESLGHRPQNRGSGPAGWSSKASDIRQKLEILENDYWTLQLALQSFQTQFPMEETSTNESIEIKTTRPEVLRWYESSDQEQNHMAARRKHQPETGKWIFEQHEFKAWNQAKGGEVLWLHGIPGAGKTILCSTIIEYMRKYCAQSVESTALTQKIVYFYFDFSDSNKQSMESLIRSCICQLLATTAQPSESAITVYEANKTGPGQPRLEDLQSVLLAEMVRTETTFLIIDALDECPKTERARFVEAILPALHKANVNILITSRKEMDIEKLLEGVATTLSIQDATVDADIATYVDTLMSQDQFLNSMDAAIKEEIRDGIVSQAKGMFRWAVCQLDAIKTCLTPAMVRERLKSMPEGLDETYHQILRKVPAHHQRFLQAALHWLAFSARPLLLEELAEAVVLRPESGRFDAESSRLLDPSMIFSLCGLLVTSTKVFPRENRTAWLDLKGECETRGMQPCSQRSEAVVVSLSHYTVKEYLVTTRLESSDLSSYYASEELGHSHLAQCCLLYLLSFNDGKLAGRMDLSTFTRNPLLQYAARFWMEHWKHAGNEHNQAPLRPMYEKFLVEERHGAYTNWLNIWNPDYRYKNSYRHSYSIKYTSDLHPHPMYWAAELGDLPLVRSLVEQGGNIQAKEGYFESALGAAAFAGQAQVVAYFLEKGVDPNLPGTLAGTPLQISIAGGSMDVVKLLIEAGADVNASGGKWSQPLVVAASQQREELVELLIASGASLNHDSKSLGSALYQAAKAGDIRTVTILLGAGADINDSGSTKGSTPLAAAVDSESVPLVQMLLRRGADVNKGGKLSFFDDGHPLSIAAHKGLLEMVRLLLSAGADVNIKMESQDSVLSAAIASNNIDVIKALIDAGADPNVAGTFSENCFDRALSRGSFDVARLLMKRGADLGRRTITKAVDYYDKEPWVLEAILAQDDVDVNVFTPHSGTSTSTPLHVAMDRHNSGAAAQLLLDRNANVNAICQSSYTTPLCIAIRENKISMAKKLIELGADFNRTINYSPFEMAVKHACEDDGSLEMVDFLLDLGVDINRNTEMAPYWPLSTAKPEILRYLVKRGLDLNRNLKPRMRPKGGFSFGDFRKDYCCSPIQLAARDSDVETIQLLLELGAELNGKPGRQGSTLHYGILSQKEEIVKFLISKGAIADDTTNDNSLLYKAMMNDLKAFVPQLIKLGANVNAPERGQSPLITAFQLKHMDIFLSLREAGAHFGDRETKVAVEAIEKGSLEDLRFLLDHGYDPNAQGGSVFKAASERTETAFMQLLLDYGADLGGDQVKPALATVCENGHMEMALFLLEHGADNHLDYALGPACSTPNNLAIVQMLLSKGAKISANDGSCFRKAGTGGCRVIIDRLLQEPMTAPERARYLGLALQTAAMSANMALCIWLIENHDAPVNYVGEPHGSPLQAALSSTSREIDSRINLVRALIQKGATLNPPLFHRPEKRGAAANLRRNLGLWLLDNAAPTFSMPLSLAIMGERWSDKGGLRDLVPEFLRQGADPNGEGGMFHTPLQAAAHKCPEHLETLLDAGADVNAIGGPFGTALHAAASQRNVAAVKLLLSRGADPRIVTKGNGSVLQAAAGSGRRDYTADTEILDVLLAAGADLHAVAGDGGSAVQEAAAAGNLETLKWLAAKGANIRVQGGRYGNAYRAALWHLWDNFSVKWHVVSWLEQHYGREGWDDEAIWLRQIPGMERDRLSWRR
ncbi:Glutathione transporter [Paramyrothecium foliicola]|nr:Glutathione transporter [Paramyrothecium foliicola]